MQKPTSALNLAIIKFVMSDTHVAKLLSDRDREANTEGMAIHCEFHLPHKTSPDNSSYTVNFVYKVTNPKLATTDDVEVFVDVKENSIGMPPTFTILNVKKY
jgi:hypothetical protein